MRYAIVILAACGGGGGDGDGGGDDGGGGPDAARPTKSGFVFLQSYDAMNQPGMPTRGGAASAGFFDSAGACTSMQQIGACKLAMCSTSPPTNAASAGTVTIAGAAMPITLAPRGDDTYAQLTVMTSLFSGGESITFSAAGAEVPAFSQALTMPSKATITSPAEPPQDSPFLIVDRTRDFTVAWAGGGSGELQVSLFGTTGGPTLTCRFPASAGTATVPSAALMMLPAGMGGFAMAAIAETDVVAGDYGVTLSGYFNAVWPDNSIVSGPTTFQ